MRSSTLLPFFLPQIALALPSIPPAVTSSSGKLYIADTGVGHRSLPVTRWLTSLRRLNDDGTNASTVRQFGPVGSPGLLPEPVGASALVFDSSAQQLYIATGEGIIRTELDGSNPVTLVNESAAALTITKSGTLYYSTVTSGLIKRAALDGSSPPQVFLNVSQGLNFAGSYAYAQSWASGLAVDERNQLLYWSADRDLEAGSIRRYPLRPLPCLQASCEEVLVEGISSPGQLLLHAGFLYWAEQGRWYNSPTALHRAKVPASRIAGPSAVVPETLVSSNQSTVFFSTDVLGETDTLKITCFAVDAASGRLWVGLMSALRTMFGKVVEVGGGVDGSGSGSGARELEVLNANVTEIGLPVGLVYVS